VAYIGSKTLSTNSDIGLKHFPDAENSLIEVRNVGLESLADLMDIRNVSKVVLEGLPNMNELLFLGGHVGDVTIKGNGNLTIHLLEGGWTGYPQPVFGTFRLSGVKHLSPCIWPDVHEFIFVNNPIEYLHFGFRQLRRLEVRNNTRMKALIPWDVYRYTWDLTGILIEDNPLLKLAEKMPRDPEDTLTLGDCPSMFGKENDAWEWPISGVESVLINANIDNTFL
jgi:hypothetical protein